MTEIGYSNADAARFRAALGTDWRVECHGAVPSTQDLCRERSDAGSGEHLCVIASDQTAGRGTHGRTWTQAPGLDTSVSVLLEPGGRYPELLLPILFGAATLTAAERIAGRRLRIKWPNDILADGRKLAGILIEGYGAGRWIGGVGINVNSTEFPPELAGAATSLSLLAGGSVDRAAVLACYLEELAGFLEPAERGEFEAAVVAFTEGLGGRGVEVSVRTAERELRGALERVAPDGVWLAGREPVPLGEVVAVAVARDVS